MEENEEYEEDEDDENPTNVTEEQSLLAIVELEQRAVFREKYGLTIDAGHQHWERKLAFWASCHLKILRHEIVDVDTEEGEIIAHNDENIEEEDILVQNNEEMGMENAPQQELKFVPEIAWE